MKDYRVFLDDGSTEDLKNVEGVELWVEQGKRFVSFLFDNRRRDYTLPLDAVYAFSVLE